MFRKYLTLIFIAACTCIAAAQKSVGQWTLFPVYNNGVSDIVDTKDKVYYTSASRLYSYDKNSNETYSYSVANKLSDSDVQSIVYNDKEGYLLVVYASTNMDVLYDNGKIVNLSDIYDASINEQKSIVSADFDSDRIYVAMPTMVVVYDAKKLTVKESMKYPGNSFGAMTASNGKIYYYDKETQRGYRGDCSQKLPKIADMDVRNYGVVLNAYSVGNAIVLYMSDNTIKVPGLFMIEDWPAVTDIAATPVEPLKQLADGTAYVVAKDRIIYFDKDGNIERQESLSADLGGCRIAFNNSLANAWVGDVDGVANYAIADDGTITVLSDKARPQNTSSVTEVAFLTASADGSRIYLSNLGATTFRTVGGPDATSIMHTADYIEDGKIFNAACFDAVPNTNISKNLQKNNGNQAIYSPEKIAIDPNNPRRYVVATFIDGVYVVEDNKQVINFSKANMPAKPFWDTNGATTYDVKFDAVGNLWVGGWNLNGASAGFTGYSMLPADKFNGDLTAVTVNDWVKYPMDEYIGEKDMNSLITKTGIHISWDRSYADKVFMNVIDTKRTYKNTADDKFVRITQVYDQDGKTYDAYRWLCGIEDARGRVWMGSANGVVEITDPTKLTDPTVRFTRLKVPRNDGTIYADYLLESEQVNAIATDAADRKWIATENSGLYLVSQSGDKILEHFTATNSVLPTNSIQSVVCDPKSNIVYVGTANGLLAYNSTSAPAADDYTEVYAYPNPVRPEYTGWITIKGLMDNSLVKIADASGNVVAQMRSDGGMAVWDGCNLSGQRVKTGVYFVFASQNNNNNPSGAVTKILVVN